MEVVLPCTFLNARREVRVDEAQRDVAKVEGYPNGTFISCEGSWSRRATDW